MQHYFVSLVPTWLIFNPTNEFLPHLEILPPIQHGQKMLSRGQI